MTKITLRILKYSLFLLLLFSVIETASAAEITVGDGQEYTNITTAIANANNSDTIIVSDGTYTENIVVNKSVTIRSENGPDSTIVQAKSVDAHIFNVTASNVTISGFNVTGATNYTAIYMLSASNGNISNNEISENYCGINLARTNNTILTNNTVSSNEYGIYLWESINGTLQNNVMTSDNNNFGVSGSDLEHFLHDIDNSNLVDSKILYYLVNETGTQELPDSGQVYVINSVDVTIKDISVSNGYDGIAFAYTNNSRIENVTASGSDAGIYLFRSHSNIVDNNHASENYYGVYIEESDDNTLTSNEIISSTADGLILDLSNRSIVDNNTINASGDDGINIDGSRDNTISNNILNSNVDDGIDLDYSESNTVSNNIVNSSEDNGIDLGYSGNNTLRSNIILDNLGSGISLYQSGNNDLISNTATNNILHGIYLNISTYNTLIDNNASENSQNGIYLYNSSDYNTLNDNVASENDCGIYLSSSNNNSLTENTANNNPNVEIGSIDPKGIVSPNEFSRNYGNGIYLENSNDNTLDSNTAKYNRYNGIYLYESSNNDLDDNSANYHNQYGIFLQSSSNHNTLNGNTANGNELGIYLYSSVNNRLISNTASSNSQNYDMTSINPDLVVYPTAMATYPCGIGLLYSDNNTLTDNIANDNDLYGIYTYYADKNTLTGNTANTNSQAGIVIRSSKNNTLANNIASYSTGNYEMLRSIELNAVINRDAISATSYGIVFSGSANSTSTGDRSIGNDYEFHSEFSNNITVDKVILNDKSAQVSFVTDERLIQLNGTETNPYSLSGKANVNGYITMSTESIAPDIALSFPDNIITKFSYSDSGMSSSGESSIALYRLNNSSWVKVSDTTLNTNGNYVSANLTEFGTFGLFKDPEPESSGDGSSLMARIRSEGTITDIPVGNDGEVTGDTVVKSSDSTSTLTLYKGTKAVDPNGDPVSKVIVTTPASLPADTPREVVESGLYFDFGPDGTTFSQDVMITLDFNPEEFEGRAPVIYTYTSEDGWIALETTIDWENGRATAMISHFSLYALFGTDAEDVQDTSVELASEDISSPVVVEEDTPAEDDDSSGYFLGIIGIVIILGAVIIFVKNQKDKEGL